MNFRCTSMCWQDGNVGSKGIEYTTALYKDMILEKVFLSAEHGKQSKYSGLNEYGFTALNNLAVCWARILYGGN